MLYNSALCRQDVGLNAIALHCRNENRRPVTESFRRGLLVRTIGILLANG